MEVILELIKKKHTQERTDLYNQLSYAAKSMDM